MVSDGISLPASILHEIMLEAAQYPLRLFVLGELPEDIAKADVDIIFSNVYGNEFNVEPDKDEEEQHEMQCDTTNCDKQFLVMRTSISRQTDMYMGAHASLSRITCSNNKNKLRRNWRPHKADEMSPQTRTICLLYEQCLRQTCRP